MFESIDAVIVTAGTALLTALLTAVVTWQIAAKRFVVENIDRERTKWRDEVRGIATCVHDAMIGGDTKELDRLRDKLRTRLNPYHYCAKGREDGKIIKSVSLPPGVEPLKQAEEFSYRIALLLKHDWQRAKHNVKLCSCKCCEPPRVSYCEWLRRQPGAP